MREHTFSQMPRCAILGHWSICLSFQETPKLSSRVIVPCLVLTGNATLVFECERPTLHSYDSCVMHFASCPLLGLVLGPFLGTPVPVLPGDWCAVSAPREASLGPTREAGKRAWGSRRLSRAVPQSSLEGTPESTLSFVGGFLRIDLTF